MKRHETTEVQISGTLDMLLYDLIHLDKDNFLYHFLGEMMKHITSNNKVNI